MTLFLLTVHHLEVIIFMRSILVSKNKNNNSDILKFLAEAKNLVIEKKFIFVPRKKNLQSLASCGLTILDAKDEILSLKAKDYYKGPKQDFDVSQPGDIWEFKKQIEGKQFYIKLKIQIQEDETILKCLSFHTDEFS